MERRLVAGNWKAVCTPLDDTLPALAAALPHSPPPGIDVFIAVPDPYIPVVRHSLPAWVAIGAEDVSPFSPGPHTGQTTAKCLVDSGARWVILGHSESRRETGVTDEEIAERARRALSDGLRAVVCVGEDEETRARGEMRGFLSRQCRGVLGGLIGNKDKTQDGPGHTAIDIAYEPIWAIGTGRTATVEDVAEAVGVIRGCMRDAGMEGGRVVYGGSVTAENAKEFGLVSGLGGVLVGGASLTREFVNIIQAVSDWETNRV